MGALERARAAYGTGAYDDATIEFLFPEVKESEDERIRSAMIRGFNSMMANQPVNTFAGVSIRDIIAYLEKQKEQKPAEWSEEDDIMLNDIIRCLPSRSSTEFNLKRINWLKHFRFRSHWTPSEEQMLNLKKAYESYDFCDGERKALESLYNDLKKL